MALKATCKGRDSGGRVEWQAGHGKNQTKGATVLWEGQREGRSPQGGVQGLEPAFQVPERKVKIRH